MNEPVVESLNYILKTSNEISFDNPAILEDDFPAFKIRLENGFLNIEMKDCFTTEEQARSLVEPYLKVWELDNFLTSGSKEFWFEFINSNIIDRNPKCLDGAGTAYPKTCGVSITTLSVTVHVPRNKYPLPPKKIRYSPDVESLFKRYEGFLNGKEPLLSMAYFCYTLITSIANPTVASKTYAIHSVVLKKLSELTSVRGDKSEARKVKNTTSFDPLSESEKKWIIETIILLIRRKAEYDFDPNTAFSEITMDVLPFI